ncbi:major capsid protein [Pectobacterium phage POP72]|uniref:Major capsid protein n=2 Tax=Axomammavirus PP1 TaxID=2733578 RepID=I7F4Z1_9CAUD|nr:major capsid protein [Pectobacterium phage PP1]AFP33696.1 major capsid protein [Pectobacterium phage PP1]ARB10954.1 major capsid protein [Pectobacterium phage POP72]
MSTPNNLTNVAVSASGEVDSLLIEKFNGKVNEQYLKGENLLGYFDVQTVTGTNTVSNKYIGETELQVLAPGQSPNATGTQTDKNQVVIDTTVIARNTVAMLHDVQGDIDSVKPKLAMNQTKQLKRMEDEMVVQQLLLGGIANTKAKRTNPRVKGHGFSINVEVNESTALESPQYLMAAIEYALEQQLEQEVDVSDVAILMPWSHFNCLRDADRIVDKTYTISQSGATVNGFVLSSFNCPVIPSNRFPKFVSGQAHHLLSNDDNGNRYDATAEMNGAIAVLFTADALLVGRTIDVTGDIFWEKKEKTYYIDTYLAEGAIPDRWEATSVVTTKRDTSSGSASTDTAADHAVVAKRANRKAVITRGAISTTALGETSAFASVGAGDLVSAVQAILAAQVKPTALLPTE